MAKKSIAKNYVYNLIYQILTIVTPLITTPYIARVLGVENNGIYGYVFSIVGYFYMFGSLGVAIYGQREIAYVQDDVEKRSKVFCEIIIVKFISYFLSIALFALLFCIKGQYVEIYRILILYLLSGMFDIVWFLQGLENFRIIAIRNIIIKTISIILVFVIVKSTNDLWIYILLYTLGELVASLSLWPIVLKKIKVSHKDLSIKRHVKPIMLLFFPQIAIQIYLVCDKTMIGLITNNISEVAYYDQAQKIIRAIILIITSLGAVMSSRNASLFSKHEDEMIKGNIMQSFRMVFLVAFPLAFGLIAVAYKFVPWYFGNGYESVINLLCINTPILVVMGLSNVTGIQYLIQVKKNKEFTISVFVACIVNVLFNFILIRLFSSSGAVVASIISETVLLGIHLFYMRKVVNVFDIIKSSVNYLISALIMFIILSLIISKMNIGIVETAIEVLIGGLLYFISLIIIRDDFFYSILKTLFSFFYKKGRK